MTGRFLRGLPFPQEGTGVGELVHGLFSEGFILEKEKAHSSPSFCHTPTSCLPRDTVPRLLALGCSLQGQKGQSCFSGLLFKFWPRPCAAPGAGSVLRPPSEQGSLGAFCREAREKNAQAATSALPKYWVKGGKQGRRWAGRRDGRGGVEESPVGSRSFPPSFLLPQLFHKQEDESKCHAGSRRWLARRGCQMLPQPPGRSSSRSSAQSLVTGASRGPNLCPGSTGRTLLSCCPR